MKLVMITPLKDEADTLSELLDSIDKQTVQPELIVLIDDGSTDKTGEIVDSFCEASHKRISIHNKPRARATGGHVVDLINQGLIEIDKLVPDWDILLKIDGDIELIDTFHFEHIVKKFEENDNLGIASGNVFHYSNEGQKIYESKYRWKTQGQAKFYRKECFDAIGGLKPFKGWDGIDDAFARSKGYITQKFYELDVLHKYETQTRTDEGGIFAGVKREVLGYRNRAYPLYFYIVKALKLIPKKPFILRAIYFLLYSFYANIFISHKLNKEEVKMIRGHIRNQIKDQFDYID